MRAIVPFEMSSNGGLKAPATLRRAIEKTSASSALGRDQAEPDPGRRNHAKPLQVELVSRDETRSFDPFWDAPRLAPAFVAQLLGQVMPERRTNVAIETAYGRAASPRMALLLDRKS
ncbi:MAG TPA: hypothetical protein VHC39_07515 [Rhizomicrobium sp.]|nr:hypothetical protein [Rhizomicrobium sp.]